jgi:glycosyltransferase involved in cell wall biosynthesis
VLGQEFLSFELIVIDDGSTDNTASVVAAYTDDRIRFIKQQNLERAAARNNGTLQAKGSFVTFLDSDDIFLPNHLSIAAEFAHKFDPQIFHQGYDIQTADGQLVKAWRSLPNPANESLLDGNYLSCLGIFIKLEIARNYLFNDNRLLAGSEDYELWLRLAARYDIYTLPMATAALIEHRGRSVLSMDAAKLIKRIDLLRYYVRRDEQVAKKFNSRLSEWEAFLDIYVALHLTMMGGQLPNLIKYLNSAFVKAPKVLLSKRWWAVIKNMLIQ